MTEKKAILKEYKNLPEEEKNRKREYGKKQISQDAWRKKCKTKRISKKLW